MQDEYCEVAEEEVGKWTAIRNKILDTTISVCDVLSYLIAGILLVVVIIFIFSFGAE